MADPIFVDCEGAGPSPIGVCQMCGRVVAYEGIVPPHQRPDILAMLARGDYDHDPSLAPLEKRLTFGADRG